MTTPGSSAGTGAGWDLRICSWNICELRGDLPALIEGLRDLAPDVLLVQEAPRLVLPQARLRWFADRIGHRILVGGRGRRGLAVLGTPDVAARIIRRGFEPVHQRLSDANSTYPRGIAAVRLSVPGGGDVVISDIHLALQEDNRLAHASRVRDLVGGAGSPAIVGGDLNETADAAARTLLSSVLSDPAASIGDADEDVGLRPPDRPSFPAAKPQRRIDAILTTPRIHVRRATTVTATATVPADRFSGASDHLPVLLDVTIPRQ
jgi:endonuclease/exonuclease/phosphatase family metal-dependent hydrolase